MLQGSRNSLTECEGEVLANSWEALLNRLRRWGRIDPGIKHKHHPHVFVLNVVTVKDERSAECAEVHQDLGFTVAIKNDGIVLKAV